MRRKVVVISTSLRTGSNSDQLARRFYDGAVDAGHDVEYVTLKDKQIRFCKGCLACQKTGSCVLRDDANAITESVFHADVVVFATPIYYYEMSGQMKTLLDRMNSMYPLEYRFRDVYFLATAADDAQTAKDRAVAGLCGWIECFEKAELRGVVFAGGVDAPDSIAGSAQLDAAYAMGRNI